jgi:dipeptidyl aminopeptidase/acylaminoacyl peptidase
MTEKVLTAPYGEWPSPISASMLAADARAFEQLVAEGDTLYWIELRPDSGRSVAVSRSHEGSALDLTPEPFEVRSRVYEYGGKALAIDRGTVYFVNKTDQQIYRQEPDTTPIALTAQPNLRFGCLQPERSRNRILAICEDHAETDLQPPVTIVAVPCGGGEPVTLVAGNDFYMDPTPSPDGSALAWITWNHPNMPWNGCELWLAPMHADGTLGPGTCIAGGPRESVCHPHWSPRGELFFISDRSGWWNLYRWNGREAAAIAPRDAEFGRPRYGMGHRSYTFIGPDEIVCTMRQDGVPRLVRVDVRSGDVLTLETGCTSVNDPVTWGDTVAFTGGTPTEPESIRRLDLGSGTVAIIRDATDATLDPRYLAAPEAITFPTSDGKVAHALYYPPLNPTARAPDGTLPPLLVHAHGGPNSRAMTAPVFGPMAITGPVYWTSRGYAYLDVNYRGSTGYGRPYRAYLDGRWGVVDVDDCIAGARYLIDRGDVDGTRVAIRGGSAGGFTTLCALTFRDFFAAGTAYFGLSDLEAFHGSTHKFESHHDHHLIGSWETERQRYRDRSAVQFADQITAPLLLLQGSEDRIVPPEQSILIRDALIARGVPVEYVEFEGEGHGFRRAENIQRSLEAEEAFYARVFGY